MGRRKLSGMKRFEITCSWEEDPLIVKRGILDFFKTSSKNMEGLDLYSNAGILLVILVS